MDESDFAVNFLRARGFDYSILKKEGITSSYHWLGCYLERFIEDNKAEVEIWNAPEAKQAYQIVNEYWEKKPEGLEED